MEISNIFRTYCSEIGNNGKAPDNNGKGLQRHCAMHANHIIEHRSCFFIRKFESREL